MANVTLADLIAGEPAQPANVLSRLRSFGIAVLPNYLSAQDLELVRQEAAALERDKSAAIIERDYHCGRSLLVDRRRWSALAYPSIEKVVNAKYLRDIATGFFKQETAFNYQFFVTRETASGVPITGLHYDRLVTLKFFIYLLDTSSENGAFECIPKTHRSVEATRDYYVERGTRLFDLPNFQLPSEIGKPIPIEGAAGTMLIFTTDVVHQGGVVSDGNERWVLRAHTRPLPLPEYRPTPWTSRQWWRESIFNPKRYYYRVSDRLVGNQPPVIGVE